MFEGGDGLVEIVVTFAVYRGVFSVRVMGTGSEVGREGTIPDESRGGRVERVKIR
jgi:hypothetical protein